jgi:hypothetical protein
VLLLIHHALTDGLGILRMLNNFWQTRPEAIEHLEPTEWRSARRASVHGHVDLEQATA